MRDFGAKCDGGPLGASRTLLSRGFPVDLHAAGGCPVGVNRLGFVIVFLDSSDLEWRGAGNSGTAEAAKLPDDNDAMVACPSYILWNKR